MCDLRSHRINNVFVLFICTLCPYCLCRIKTSWVHKEERTYTQPSPQVILPKGKGIRQLKTYNYKKFEASWPIRIDRRCMTMSLYNYLQVSHQRMIVWKLKPLCIIDVWEGGNPISLTPVECYNYGHNRQPTITIYLLCWDAFNLIILSGNIFIFNAPLSDFGAYVSSCIHGNNRPHSVVITIFPLSCQRYYFSYTCSI